MVEWQPGSRQRAQRAAPCFPRCTALPTAVFGSSQLTIMPLRAALLCSAQPSQSQPPTDETSPNSSHPPQRASGPVNVRNAPQTEAPCPQTDPVNPPRPTHETSLSQSTVMTMDSMNPGRGSEWVMCITAEGSTSTTVVLMKLSRSSRFSVSWACGGRAEGV